MSPPKSPKLYLAPAVEMEPGLRALIAVFPFNLPIMTRYALFVFSALAALSAYASPVDNQVTLSDDSVHITESWEYSDCGKLLCMCSFECHLTSICRAPN